MVFMELITVSKENKIRQNMINYKENMWRNLIG